MSIQAATILFVYHVFGKKVGTEDRSLTTLQLWAVVVAWIDIHDLLLSASYSVLTLSAKSSLEFPLPVKQPTDFS